jgi:hypothetical protein
MTQTQLFDFLWDVVTTQERLDREAGPGPVVRARAMDASLTVGGEYHVCEDGCLRLSAERAAWLANGWRDARGDLRRELQARHCGDVRNHNPREGHICQCRPAG